MKFASYFHKNSFVWEIKLWHMIEKEGNRKTIQTACKLKTYLVPLIVNLQHINYTHKLLHYLLQYKEQ